VKHIAGMAEPKHRTPSLQRSVVSTAWTHRRLASDSELFEGHSILRLAIGCGTQPAQLNASKKSREAAFNRGERIEIGRIP